jgi:hypothetical protein
MRPERDGIGLPWLRVWGTVIVVSFLAFASIAERQGQAYWTQRCATVWSVPAVTFVLALFLNSVGNKRGLLAGIGGCMLGVIGLFITAFCSLILTVGAVSEAKQAGLPVPGWAEAIDVPESTG